MPARVLACGLLAMLALLPWRPVRAEAPVITDAISMYAGQALVQSAPGALKRFDKQRIARIEVGVEAAVRETGFLHHVGHTDTPVALPANRTRGGTDDALVRIFFAAVGGTAH